MTKVLITGASGFLGTAITKAAAKKENWDVFAVASGRRQVVVPEGASLLTTDLRDPLQRKALLENVRPDIMLHLAWNLEGKGFLNSESNLTWLQSSIHLLHLFAQNGGKRFLFAGSSAEYGYELEVCRESEPGQPSDLYGMCKAAFTNVAMQFCRLCGIEYVTARYFSVYGPGESNLLHAVPTAFHTLLSKQTFVCKAPNNCWDYIYIDDIAKATIQAVESDYCGIVNIASGQPVSMRSVFSSIAEAVGRVSFLAFENETAAGKILVGDNSILRERIGYSDFTTFETGVGKTAAWWERQLR